MIDTDIQKNGMVCKHCGCDISGKHKGAKFCSKQCANTYNVCSPNHQKQKIKNIWTCKRCGKEFHAPKDRSTFCSRECAFAYKAENKKPEECAVYFKRCDICDTPFTDRHRTKHSHCSPGCSAEYVRRYSKQYSVKKQSHERVCSVCGRSFIKSYGHKGVRSFCSEECRRSQAAVVRRKCKTTRRARKRRAFVEPIDLHVLFERDRGRCRICGRKLNLLRRAPDMRAATIDHITPLSLGGLHEYKNVQLSCFICNSRKSNGAAPGGDQLLLFGL